MTTGNTTVSTRSGEARAYLDGVGSALADLPAEDRADLLDELGSHLDDIAAEGDRPLAQRLGSPQEYAAELRASAGLPPAAARAGRLASIRGGWRELRSGPVMLAVTGFCAAVRPLWWVVRAWVVVALVAMFPGQSTPTWSGVLLVVPRVNDGTVGLLVLMLAIIGSVQLGRHDWSRHVLARRGRLALNVVAALALLPVVGSLSDASRSASFGTDRHVYVATPGVGVYSGGEQVWNVYAYDATGAMLHDVRLYDQDGNPLDLGLAEDSTLRQVADSYGQRADNAFPYRYLDPESGVVEDENAAPDIVVPPLLGVTATPTATPSAAPSPGSTDGKP